MGKTDRWYRIAICTFRMMFVLYWVSIVTSILCLVNVTLLACILYALSVMAFSCAIYSNKGKWKKRFLTLIACETIQLVPCALIITVNGLV